MDVMDIGSGTGILSMYAANVGSVKSIYAIECNPTMVEISAEVFKENLRGKLVKLIPKYSTDLKVGEDIPSKASLVVSETLDSGVFGEGILESLMHAKQHLLEPDGKVVPWKVKIHVAGYKSKSLTTNQILTNETFYEYIFLNNFRLTGKRDEPYDAEYVDKVADFKLVTSSADTLEVNFNDLQSMQQHFDGSIVKEFQLESSVNNDYLDGFVVWFTLYLNEMEPENFISTEPKSGSCWTQALFKLRQRILIQMYEVLKLSISCKDGVLKIHHELDAEPDKVDFEVDLNVLKFLNDEYYLHELEYAASNYMGKKVNGLDLSPFPYVGILLLKDCRLEKLWCRKSNETLIKMIASMNVIDESSFVFLDDDDLIFTVAFAKFDLIILNPFHQLGDLDNRVICEYKSYQELLEPNGLMIPKKICLFGELINSDWLIDSCRITDIGVKRMKIDKFINNYATEIHLDLNNSLDCERLTGIFKISEIYFDDELHETTVDVPIRNTNPPVHAIFFHYIVQLAENLPEIATNRKSLMSCFKRSAQVLRKELRVDSTSVKVSFIQNTGIVKCDVSL